MPLMSTRGGATVRGWRPYTTLQPETIALIARMTTKPNNARTKVIDALIKALKTAGVWAKLDVLQLYAAADAQAASLNWVTNNYNESTSAGSPLFTVDRGFTVDANLITPGWSPSFGVQYQQNSAHVGMWSNTATTNASAVVGIASGDVKITPRDGSDLMNVAVNSGTFTAANAAGTGWFTGNRPGANSMEAHRNGALLGSSGLASNARSGNFIGIGNTTGCQVSAFSAGASLSGADHANFYNAMRAYMTAVGVP